MLEQGCQHRRDEVIRKIMIILLHRRRGSHVLGVRRRLSENPELDVVVCHRSHLHHVGEPLTDLLIPAARARE